MQEMHSFVFIYKTVRFLQNSGGALINACIHLIINMSVLSCIVISIDAGVILRSPFFCHFLLLSRVLC